MAKKKEIKIFMNHLDDAKNNMDRLYRLSWGKCKDELQAEVKGIDDYGAKSGEINAIWLRGALQVVTSGIGSKADVIFIEQEALLISITMHQGQSDSNDEYLKCFKSSVITFKLAS